MTRKKSSVAPILHVRKDDSTSAIYAKARRTFTAADLARFAEDEKGIPARKLLAELEAMVKPMDRKTNRKSADVRAK